MAFRADGTPVARPGAGQLASAVTLAVPPGNYVVMGRIELGYTLPTFPPITVTCFLTSSGVRFASGDLRIEAAYADPYGSNANINGVAASNLFDAVAVTAPVAMGCEVATNAFEGLNLLEIRSARLVATQVSTIGP